MSQHRYDVIHHDRGYWQLTCRDCHWVGKRITKPSAAQSKQRMAEWDDHAKLTKALE